jgi:hypothetical protein
LAAAVVLEPRLAGGQAVVSGLSSRLTADIEKMARMVQRHGLQYENLARRQLRGNKRFSFLFEQVGRFSRFHAFTLFTFFTLFTLSCVHARRIRAS